MLGAGTAQAQRTAEMSVLILANNRGIFVCTGNVAIFNFGAVNADGADFGTTDLSIGNGAAHAEGDLDLRLSVLDEDPVGSDVWVVRLRANGTP